MCIPDTDHLNGNLLLNKENRENLESAGELPEPETDSRMKTLKYCVTQPTLEVPSVAMPVHLTNALYSSSKTKTLKYCVTQPTLEVPSVAMPVHLTNEL